MTKLIPLTWCQIRGLRFNRKPLLNPLNNPIYFNILSISKHSRSRAPHTPGYAAQEQVEDECHLGPLTDLYAVGALMWRVVTGSAPPRVEAHLSAPRPGRVDPLVIDADTGGGRFWFSSQPWSSSSPAKESAPPRPVSERAVGEVFRDALKGGGEGLEMAVLPTGNFQDGFAVWRGGSL